VVSVGNGTDAITLTLRALGIGPGDEVITTAFTAAPSVGAIVAAGARPVLADVDPATRTLDPRAAAAAITPRTRAVMPVHLYGQPADLARFLDLTARHGLALIEDAAQAHGALYEGRMAGSIGSAGCFSFYPTKNLGALGDGGAVATNDDALAERIRRLRHLGQSARYVHAEHATHSRLDELQAAVLRVKLTYLDRWTAERCSLAARYGSLLQTAGPCAAPEQPVRTATDLDQQARPQLPVELSETRCCWHQYVVQVPAGERASVREQLRQAGVGTDVHYPTPVHLQPGYADLANGPGSLPVTESLAESVLSLPMFVGLTDREQAHIATALREALRSLMPLGSPLR
jgi:dTDP-4-amino-4,6-dideoxygalactose transaminase